LRAQSKIVLLDEEGLAAFVMAGNDGMVLFTQEPDQQPETWDVAVILPEVLKLTGDRLRAAIISPELARKEKVRFGITRWPTLVFVRDGGYVGAIEGMRNWEEYTREIAEMLERPIGRPPSVGIPVTAAGETSDCH
jgi:hydrogenase-1 operon protein HyaE